MENNNYYELIGVINIFGVYPDFIFPIFKKDDKYFFQKCEYYTIKSFNVIKDDLFLKMIRFFNNSTEYSVKAKYSIGDEPVIAFQVDKNSFFVSNGENFISFAKDFYTDDDILREQIDALLDQINYKRMKQKRKRKKLNI